MAEDTLKIEVAVLHLSKALSALTKAVEDLGVLTEKGLGPEAARFQEQLVLCKRSMQKAVDTLLEEETV